MDNRRKKHIKYRPSKAQSAIGAAAGALFIVLGLTVVMPLFGPFGIIWTLFAVAITGMNVYQLTGNYVGPEITVEDEGEEAPPPPAASATQAESRLKQLQTLRDQLLISEEEYEEKRKEILKEL